MVRMKVSLDDEQKEILMKLFGLYRYVYNNTMFSLIKNKKNICCDNNLNGDDCIENIRDIDSLNSMIEKNSFLNEADYISLLYAHREAVRDFKNNTKTNKYKFMKKNSNEIYNFINFFDDIEFGQDHIKIPIIPSNINFDKDIDVRKHIDEDKPHDIKFMKIDEDIYIELYESNFYREEFLLKEIFKTNAIGISRSLEDFASMSSGEKIVFLDSLKSIRKKYFRENIKIKNRIYGSLNSKKNIEDNKNFINRKKSLEKINVNLELQYREFIDGITDHLSDRYDNIYIEDINILNNIDDEEYIKINEFIEKQIDVSKLKKEKINSRFNNKINLKSNKEIKLDKNNISLYKDDIRDVDSLFWRLFVVMLEEKMKDKGKNIFRVDMKSIPDIELNEFERYQKGKSKGGKKGQLFNKEQKLIKAKNAQKKYKKFTNPSRARDVIYRYITK